MADGVGDRRCGIAVGRLEEKALLRQLRQLLPQLSAVVHIAHHEEALLGEVLEVSMVGELEEALASVEEVDELLRVTLPAVGPEAAARATGKDHTVLMMCRVKDHKGRSL